eukprot:5863617-Pleurochrysis_carterae.AAC.5
MRVRSGSALSTKSVACGDSAASLSCSLCQSRGALRLCWQQQLASGGWRFERIASAARCRGSSHRYGCRRAWCAANLDPKAWTLSPSSRHDITLLIDREEYALTDSQFFTYSESSFKGATLQEVLWIKQMWLRGELVNQACAGLRTSIPNYTFPIPSSSRIATESQVSCLIQRRSVAGCSCSTAASCAMLCWPQPASICSGPLGGARARTITDCASIMKK